MRVKRILGFTYAEKQESLIYVLHTIILFKNYFNMWKITDKTLTICWYSMSANTIRKAKKLVESGGVVKIEDDLFQIKSSSDPEKSYFVTSDTCECPGFKNFYKFHHGKGLKANCSHLEAIRIFKKEDKT